MNGNSVELGELGSTFTGLTGKTKEDFGHGDAKFVTYMNVFQNAVASLEQLDSVEIDPKQNEVKKGDVFFTTSSETPEEVGMSSVWKYNYDNVYLNSFTFGYRPNIEFDLDYLAAMLRSTTVRKKITLLAQGISRYNISKTKMMDIEVPVPSLEEQAKIGAFLSNVEQTITLQQHKLDQLNTLKKGLLQKMFADKKHPQPELRFKGFSGDWEQRKFSEILAKSDGLRRGPFGSALKKEFFISSSEYTVYEQNNAIYNTWKTRYFITPEKFQELHKFQLMPGDFILSGAGTIGRIAQVPANITKGVFNQALIRIRINPEWMDKKFFLIWMQSENMQRKLTQANPGSAMTNLVPMSEIKKWEIIIPSKAEQNKIGEFIQKLNSLIALHQRKLDKLKKMKAAYLNEMFV
jgi:type I restriction enzyme S subunit